MAKGNYLFGFLLCTTISICCRFSGDSVGTGYHISTISNRDPAGSTGREELVKNGSVIIQNTGSQTSGFRPLPSKTPDLRKLVQAIYVSQIGVREAGLNSGPDVENYLRYVNLTKGNPWCAAFVCWVFGQAGISNPRSGWSPDLFTKTRAIKPVGNALVHYMAGDVFGLYFAEKKRIAHVGFIDKEEGSWIVTVEGNTNISGGREGDGVYRKRRFLRSINRAARFIN